MNGKGLEDVVKSGVVRMRASGLGGVVWSLLG